MAEGPAVYIETSVLDPLPITLTHAEFERVIALARGLKSSVIIPRLAVMEFIEHKQRRLRDAWAKVQEVTRSQVGFRFGDENGFLTKEWEVLGRLEREILESLRRQGIELLETVSVDQPKLVEMSVKGIPPFSEKTGDRGFKDALILFSILADARRRKAANERCLVLTNDDRFIDAVRELPEASGLGIVVARSLREAIEPLEKFQTAQELRIQRRRVEDLRKFLVAHKDQIGKFIRAVRPAFAVVRAHGEYGELLDLDMWRTIKSIDLTEIEEPVLGGLPESGQGRLSISFIAKVTVTSTLTNSEVQGETQKGHQWFNVEGSVSVQRRRTKFIYSDLQMDNARIVSR